eukprot:Nitzschia sp. Nitz4//scaffold3_size479765//174869//177919//NITZ4_000072-RA/size479765-processed-gene-1.440-mRNA-1//-1//CDS//3329550674//2500//frame0
MQEGRYGHGGGRGYRGGGRHRRGRDGGHRHQPYQGRGGGGGGGRRVVRGNRFEQDVRDPQVELLKDMAALVSRVGEFQHLQEQPEEAPGDRLRPVEFSTASNINALVPSLCTPDKVDILLKHSPDATAPEEKVGKLVHILVSCAASLPLQTPCYAALSLSLHEHVKENPAYQGVASRCVQYTMLQIARELDTTALMHNPTPAQSTCRLKLLLRYLCMMSNLGAIHTYQGETSIDSNSMTLTGLFTVLVDAAVSAAHKFNRPVVAQWLASLVLSNLPYLVELPNVPSDLLEEKIYKPLQELLSSYRSTFTPGVGTTALLLQAPPAEEQEEDEDEEDEEEGDDDGSGVVCDSLQDLLRSVKRWRKEGEASRFSLPLDSPWKALSLQTGDGAMQGDSEAPLSYSDQPLFLSFPQECQLLSLLLAGDEATSPLKLQMFQLQGCVFGRLPIFGSAPDPDDEDEEEAEEMDEAAPTNENLQAFKSLSFLDRYFVAETIRDCLISHESHVSPAGVEYGSAKSTAEELLRVGHMFSSNSGEDPSRGMEYAILETMFAMIAQASDDSALNHVFLSRVVLELTRLEPSRISQALLLAITNLFQDYLPSLVPAARENYSRWFAFHLTNTDYQWHSGYWQQWEPYVVAEKENVRGAFVKRALNLMAENVSDPTPIVKHCFRSVAQSLAGELLGRTAVVLEDCPVMSLGDELYQRMWSTKAPASQVLEFLYSDEVSNVEGINSKFARTDILARVILEPARVQHEGMKAILTSVQETGDAPEDKSALLGDPFSEISQCIKAYKDTIVGVMEKEAAGGDGDVLAVAAFFLLRVEALASYDSSLLEGLVSHLVRLQVTPGQAVLRWVLRDFGEQASSAPVLSNWAVHVKNALRESFMLVVNEMSMGGIMTVDDGSSGSLLRDVAAAVEKTSGLLTYAVKQVCTLLETTNSGESKKVTSIEVALVEGLKSSVYAYYLMIVTYAVNKENPDARVMVREVEGLVAASEAAPSALATVCTGDSVAQKLVKKSIERL